MIESRWGGLQTACYGVEVVGVQPASISGQKLKNVNKVEKLVRVLFTNAKVSSEE